MAPAGRLNPTGPTPPRGRIGRSGPTRPPRRLRWVAAGLLLVPLLELVVLLTVGRVLGGWWVLGLLCLSAVVGVVLIRRAGGRSWRSLREASGSGRMPGRELGDAMLALVGGLLLLFPGLLTDLVGVFLVLPPTRSLSRRLLATFVGARVATITVPGGAPFPGPPGAPQPGPRRRPGQGEVIEGEIVDDTPPPGR